MQGAIGLRNSQDASHMLLDHRRPTDRYISDAVFYLKEHLLNKNTSNIDFVTR